MTLYVVASYNCRFNTNVIFMKIYVTGRLNLDRGEGEREKEIFSPSVFLSLFPMSSAFDISKSIKNMINVYSFIQLQYYIISLNSYRWNWRIFVLNIPLLVMCIKQGTVWWWRHLISRTIQAKLFEYGNSWKFANFFTFSFLYLWIIYSPIQNVCICFVTKEVRGRDLV